MPAVLRGVFRQPEASIRRRTEEIYDASMVSGTLPAVNRVVGPIDTAGYQVAAVQLTGTWVATVNVEQSNDGVTWYNTPIISMSSGTSFSSGASANSLYFCQIVGRYLRVRNTAYTSGTVGVSVSLRVGMAEGQLVQITGTPAVTLSGTANSVITPNSVQWDETATALGISAVLTGAGRDLTALAAGSNHRYEKFGSLCFADQAGTMRLELSRDNTTWRRASADVAVAAGAAGLIEIPVAARYGRLVYTNGGVAQTAFMPQTFVYG